jgi:hypothetical protein
MAAVAEVLMAAVAAVLMAAVAAVLMAAVAAVLMAAVAAAVISPCPSPCHHRKGGPSSNVWDCLVIEVVS